MSRLRQELRDRDRCALVADRASRWNRGHHGADPACRSKKLSGARSRAPCGAPRCVENSNFPCPRRPSCGSDRRTTRLGLSTDDSSRFSGFHSAHVLIVIDEAPGVRPEVYEAIEGIRGAARCGCSRSEIRPWPAAPSDDAFTSARDLWRTFTINAFDTPNLHGLPLEALRHLPQGLPENVPIFAYRPRPYLATRRWVYEKLWESGEDSPFWQSRVLGSFPEQAENSLIPLIWLEAARSPKVLPDDEAQPYAGIDVAEAGGDETVCVVRTRAGRIIALRSWHGNSRGPVLAFLREFQGRLTEINYDRAWVGAYFADDFESFGFMNINGINVGEASHFPDRYRNLKAQLYWSLRERFQNGEVSGLNDDICISQLTSIRYEINPPGKSSLSPRKKLASAASSLRIVPRRSCWPTREPYPGIIGYYRQLVEHKAAVEAALKRGEQPPEPPRHNRLIDRYWASRAKWDAIREAREQVRDEEE